MQYYDVKKDSTEEIDKAWKEERYDKVLSLLKRDWVFPEEFQIEKLTKDDDDDQKLLKEFVEARLKLHQNIQEGNLEEVKKLTYSKDSKLYLNPQNQSAASTAIKSKQIEVYVYLKSIGVKLVDLDDLDDREMNVLYDLSLGERNNLREIWRSDLIRPDAVTVLTSKFSSLQKGVTDKVKNYYERLKSKIPEILEVVREEKDLEVIFDFAASDIRNLCPLEKKSAGGLTVRQEKTIYMACKRDEKEILGTLAQELAHMVMEMVFKNNFNPYEKSDQINNNNFEIVTQGIKEKFEDLEDPESETSGAKNSEAEIISRVFRCYLQEEHHLELIVRVPQILTEFENGEEWLQQNVPTLLEFYQQNVKPKCEEFISQSHLLKSKRSIRSLNENIGEINNIKQCHLFFQDVSYLEGFLRNPKILLLITKNTRLGLFRVLQALYQKNYVNSYGNFIVLKFETCINEFDNVKVAFFSVATDSLVLDCKSVSQESLKEGVSKIKELKEGLGRNKNIVFVLEENQKIAEELSEENKSVDWHMVNDQNFLLNDLDAESKEIILDKKIVFQGNEMTLGEFGKDEEEFCKLIDADIIGDLFENEKYHVGSKIFGFSSLEVSYAQIFQQINMDSLMNEMKTSNNIFIFIGEKDQIIKKLYFEGIHNHISDINLKYNFVPDKRIFFMEENFENHFKKFCQCNSVEKVYLIRMNSNETFMLQQIYNPDFYIPREIRKLENNVLIWEDPNDSIKNVRLFVNEDLCKKTLIKEKELVQEIVDKKVLIITDEPGMGKSTTVTTLYESDTIIRNHWIIRINLNDHLNIIKSIPPSNLNVATVIDFLQDIESNSSNKLAKIIFDLVSNLHQNFSKCLLLTFDGFDEIFDGKDRKKIIRLLRFLKFKTKCKIWITSRLHYQELLEDKLKTFALQIHPIDDVMKKRFIKIVYYVISGERNVLLCTLKPMFAA